jgi:hypothetical protein
VTLEINAAYLRDIARTFANYKALGDGALAQLPDAHIHTQLDPESNSVAIVVKHLAGNLRSRFTDFLTTDGEKPDRDRDAEFEMPAGVSRAEVMQWWHSSWAIALAAIEALTPGDLGRTVTIRREEFLVVEALNRLSTHAAYHVGQIVYLAKHFAGPTWTSLTVPKGKSASFSQGDYKTKGIARKTT